jgi:hypothetical protein
MNPLLFLAIEASSEARQSHPAAIVGRVVDTSG